VFLVVWFGRLVVWSFGELVVWSFRSLVVYGREKISRYYQLRMLAYQKEVLMAGCQAVSAVSADFAVLAAVAACFLHCRHLPHCHCCCGYRWLLLLPNFPCWD
jgi:hypothetical protein